MARPIKKERGIYARKDAEGKTLWYCRVYLNGRDQREGPFEMRTGAKNRRDDLRSQHRLGKLDPEGGWQLVEDLIDRHLKVKADKKDQHGQKRFSSWWRERFRAKGIKRVKDLTPRILEEAREDLKTQIIKVGPEPLPPIMPDDRKSRRKPAHKQGEMIAKHREPATINRYFVWLQSMLRPVKQKRRQLFDDWEWERESKGRTRYLSPHEEDALTAALGATYGPWARFAILTGLRQSEQFRLEWRHVDLDLGILTLPDTKAGHMQYQDLSEEAVAILRSFDSWQSSKWVFPSENQAAPIDVRNFYHRVWIPAVRRAGIEWATWHALRHTGASRLAEKGANESAIADFLRHSGLGLVRRYAHLSRPHMKVLAEMVSSYGRDGQRVIKPETGTKPEKQGLEGERNGKPGTVELRVSEGENIGAPDTN
jgi:integrase